MNLKQTRVKEEKHIQSLFIEVPLKEAIACTKVALGQADCNYVQSGRRILATKMNLLHSGLQIDISFESSGYRSCELILICRTWRHDDVGMVKVRSLCQELFSLVSAEAVRRRSC
jgi:hypothetical protein